MIATTTPFQQFFDLDGSPLDEGYIYFGAANLNPETAFVAIFWDEAGTQPAAQPVRTLKGYPVRAGAPAVIFTADPYSMTIRNKRGQLIATIPEWPTTVDITAALAAPSGSNLVGYQPLGAAPTAWTVQNKLRESQSLMDNGATGDGIASDDVGFNRSKVVNGVVWVPPAKHARISEAAFNRVAGTIGPGYWVTQTNCYLADDTFGGQGVVNSARTTASDKDAFYGEHYGTGTGYAFHGISYANTGSGLGGATWASGAGSGVIGNRRGLGSGNGVAGTRLEDGSGSGVAGTMAANGNGLRFSTIRNIAAGWVFTLPAAALLSGSLYFLFRLI